MLSTLNNQFEIRQPKQNIQDGKKIVKLCCKAL